MAYCAVEARLISAVYFERGTILFLPIRSQEDYFFIISVQNHAKGEKKKSPDNPRIDRRMSTRRRGVLYFQQLMLIERSLAYRSIMAS